MEEVKTLDELYAALLVILPDAQLGEDNDGELIIYTNKRIVHTINGELLENLD